MSIEVFQSMMETLVDMQRRMGGVAIKGRVSADHIDPKAGKVRLIIGQDDDGNDVLSPWVPYAQTAGALKIHSPPSADQTMEISSDSGDVEQGTARALHWSDDNKSPSEKGDEQVLTFGDVRAELRGDELLITVGGFQLSLKSDGATYTVGGVKHVISGDGLNTEGGKIEHDGKNIGKDHIHGGVVPGGAVTDVPAN